MTDDIQSLTENIFFDYDGYQVVRGEFLSRTGVPEICFDGIRLSVNTVCLKKMPDVRYVQFLVNSSERKLALRPCSEDDRDSFPWCNMKNNKRIPRKIVCRLFIAKLAELMSWRLDKKYRIIGTLFKTNSERIMLFDLKSAEEQCCSRKKGEMKDTGKKYCLPDEWKDHFGLTVKEHEMSITVNLFEDYTVYRLNG